MRHSRFLIFGGAFSFQIPVQYPGRQLYEESIKSVTHNLYALRTEYRPCRSAFQMILSSAT